MTDNGLVTVPSQFSASKTMQRFVAAITARGMTVSRASITPMAQQSRHDAPSDRVAHLRPSKGGTPLMLSRQTAGIDLPLKALAWQDENGDNWLTLNSASWLAQRHGLGNELQPR